MRSGSPGALPRPGFGSLQNSPDAYLDLRSLLLRGGEEKGGQGRERGKKTKGKEAERKEGDGKVSPRKNPWLPLHL